MSNMLINIRRTSRKRIRDIMSKGFMEFSRVWRSKLAVMAVVIAVAGLASTPQGRYVGFDDAPFQYIEIAGDTVTTVTKGYGLMPAVRSEYRMVNPQDSVMTLELISYADGNEISGVKIATPVEDHPEGIRIITVSDHELLLQPMNLPYVDEEWHSQWLSKDGTALIIDGQPIGKESVPESFFSSLLDAVKTDRMDIDLLRPREAYCRYGAVGINGAMVFTSK